MKKSNCGETAIPVVVVILLALVFAGLSLNSYMTIMEQKDKIANETRQKREKEEAALKAEKRDIHKIVNVVGFYSGEQEEVNALLDAIATRIVVMCRSEELGLDTKIKPSQPTFTLDSVDKKVFEDLGLCQISEELRKNFNNKKHPLSDAARINYQSEDSTWWVIGGVAGEEEQPNIYLLESKGDRSALDVYLIYDKKKLAADLNYVADIVGLQELMTACSHRITCEASPDKKAGLREQMEAQQAGLKEKQKEYQGPQKRRTETAINAKLEEIRKARSENQKIREDILTNWRKANTKIVEKQQESLEAKEKETKLKRKQHYQKRLHKEITQNLDERIRELEEEARGQLGIEEKLAETIAKVDKFLLKLEKVKEAEKAKKIEEYEELEEAVATTEAEVEETQISKARIQETPDGEIVYVDEKNQIAFIDLGRTHGVGKGLKFEVFCYGKGGVTRPKGQVIVRKMEANMSMVGIIEIKDPLDPIIPGDKIKNPVYDRNKTKYFVIAGRLEKYSLQELRTLLERLGGKIEEDISAKTDFVVLGEGFRDHPIYKKATERGIEMILESEFMNYLEE